MERLGWSLPGCLFHGPRSRVASDLNGAIKDGHFKRILDMSVEAKEYLSEHRSAVVDGHLTVTVNTGDEKAYHYTVSCLLFPHIEDDVTNGVHSIRAFKTAILVWRIKVCSVGCVKRAKDCETGRLA